MSCRIPPFSIAGYKGALGRRGGLPWLRALPACAHRLSARRAGSAAPPGALCGVTASPHLPGAESPPIRRSRCPVQGHLQPVTPTVPGAVSTHTLLPVPAIPVRLFPELPAARSPPASRSAELQGHGSCPAAPRAAPECRQDTPIRLSPFPLRAQQGSQPGFISYAI